MKRCSIIFLFSLICMGSLCAQSSQELFDQARQHAYAQEYEEAEQLLNTILLANANHYDAKFLLAQVYAWKKQYPQSLQLLSVLLSEFPVSPDAYELSAKVLLWKEDYSQCIAFCDRGIQLYPESLSLQITKAYALKDIGDTEEAISILENIVAQDNEHLEAQQLLKQLTYKEPVNAIMADYAYAYFDNTFTPWHTASLAYKRKTSWGSVTGRISSTYRFDQHGTQYEIDAYPKINKRSYAYLNTGISNNTVFPQYRFGAEYFRLLSGNIEVSAGIRGLFFDENYVNILTLQVGHYFSHYWLSARGFLATIEHKHAPTGTLTIRRFFLNPDQYLTCYLGSGATPLSVVSINEIRRLETNGIAFDYQHPFYNRTLLAGVKVAYDQEVYPEIRSTNRYTLFFSLAKRF